MMHPNILLPDGVFGPTRLICHTDRQRLREACVRRLVISILIAFLSPLVWAAPAAAQTGDHELTVFAGVSLGEAKRSSLDGLRVLRRRHGPFGPFDSGRSELDGSAEFGVRFGRYVTDTVTVEGDLSIAPTHTLRERVEFGCEFPPVCLVPPAQTASERVVAWHYGAGVGIDLPGGGGLQPVLLAGLGGVTHDSEAVRETRLAVRLGGALRASLGRLDARFEVLDVIVADHFVTNDAEHDVHVRVGIGVRW